MSTDFTPIPTTIFTGFLGSGKTTIILHLVEILQKQNIQVLYIKNEIGTETIDGELARQQNIETKELLNGCICCTLVGPFIHSIDELVATHRPDRIIIEASGAADPAALALMVKSHPKLERDGVLTVIDVVNFEGYEDLSFTAKNQTKFTDLLVFNKTELVDPQRVQAVVGYVRELNEHSPIVEATNGRLHPDVVFGAASPELVTLLNSDTTDHSHHLGKDTIQTFAVPMTREFSEEELLEVLKQLPQAVYRVKGFVPATGNKTFLVNKVGNRSTVEIIKTHVDNTKLVCIGFGIQAQKQAIEKILTST